MKVMNDKQIQQWNELVSIIWALMKSGVDPQSLSKELNSIAKTVASYTPTEGK